MASLGFKYFENTPLNNISEFSNKNQDKIKFRLSPVSGQLVRNVELVLNGTLQINSNDTTPYASNSNVAVGLDNIAGISALWERQEINNASMNVLLEQSQDIDFYTKMIRASKVSTNDLKFGYYSCNDICNVNTQLIRQQLTRDNLEDDGIPFSVNLTNPFLNSSYEIGIRIDSFGGLIITLSLNSVKQALFNIFGDNINKLDDDFNFTLRNLKLFTKAYILNSPPSKTYSYRSYNNILQTLQTNNESISFEPLTQQTHSIIAIFQPNNTTRNNYDANALNSDELIGLKSYKVGLSGLNLPYDFSIQNTTDYENIVLDNGNQPISEEVGSAENILHLIGSLKTRYRPTHTLINSKNEVQSYDDLYQNDNYNCSNFRAIGVNYSYNFMGYTTNMTNEQYQLSVESLINTNTNKLIPDKWENTSFIGNFFVNHNKTINMQNLQVFS